MRLFMLRRAIMIVFAVATLAPVVASAQVDATDTPPTTIAATSTPPVDTSASSTPVATSTPPVATTTPAATPATPPVTPPIVHTNIGLEAQVRSYFSDIPVMAEIARCESKFRQYDNAGNPLDGGSGSMIGLFQISAAVHRAFALSLGFDINTPEGNMGYAKYLYQKEGTDPWLDSFSCWKMSAANPEQGANAAGTPTLYSDLSLGKINDQVLTLQRILNAQGYIIATDGPGSPGNETNKFGALTKIAVRKFQCAMIHVCSGDEYTTGYGYVGARTRAALLGVVTVNADSSSTPVTDPNAAEIARLTALIQVLTHQLASLIAARVHG